jgi:hypothetical protein
MEAPSTATKSAPAGLATEPIDDHRHSIAGVIDKQPQGVTENNRVNYPRYLARLRRLVSGSTTRERRLVCRDVSLRAFEEFFGHPNSVLRRHRLYPCDEVIFFLLCGLRRGYLFAPLLYTKAKAGLMV